MKARNETRAIVEDFLSAWTRRDERAARALLADDLEYTNVLGTYHSADALLPALMGFAAQMRGAPIHEIVVADTQAAVLYDCECPPPIGLLCTAWFVRVEEGKIRSIRSVFDATELRKVYSARSEEK